MKGIQLRNKANKSAEVMIYEDIGEGLWTSGVTAQGFLKDLKALGEVDTIDIRINSNGGSVFDGIAIYNALKRHPAQKNVYVDGIAASIASIIAMAGDTITMGDGTFMMIHNASGLSMGNAADMRGMADILEGIDAQLVDIYTNRTGMDSETIAAMMTAETWMNSADSIGMGFADAIGESLKIAAHANADRFHNIPAVLTNSHREPIEVPNAPAAVAVVSQPVKKETTMNIMENLKARASEHQTAASNIRTKATDEGRDLTNAEREVMQGHLDAYDSVQIDIRLQDRLETADNFLNASAGRAVTPNGLQNTVLRTARDKNTNGFNSFGEFCAVVRKGVTSPQNMDSRLLSNAALGTYGSEGSGADGGFAVPPEWRSQIMQLVSGEDSLLSMTDQQTASGNSITFPIDETTAWQSAGGVLAYWGSEAAAMTQSKPALKESTLKLDKLTALIPVTDELLEDAAAMGSYVAAKAGEKINFKVNDAIINGTGVGQPLGIMNAACTVSVAKETNQAAATILGLNLLKMYSRMPSMNRRRAVWLINQDIESQLMSVNIETKNVAGSENVSGMPAYLPPGGLSGSPYATLFGRPIIATEGCQTIGTVGDIVFADLGSYLTVVKSGGVRADTSIHLWFDQNTTAFRFTLRMAGQPWLSAAIARKNGSNTLSHFVTLATR